jgi:cysteine sulfinate desulfinase/cysteine desulfurase-like protein
MLKPAKLFLLQEEQNPPILRFVVRVRNLKAKRILINPLEHHCVLHTAEFLEKNDGIELEYLKINAFGEIDLVNLEKLLKSSDKINISIHYAWEQ